MNKVITEAIGTFFLVLIASSAGTSFLMPTLTGMMIDLPNLRSAADFILLALRISAWGTLYLAAIPESVWPLLIRMRGESSVTLQLPLTVPVLIGSASTLTFTLAGMGWLRATFASTFAPGVVSSVRCTFIGVTAALASIVEVLIGS